MVGGASPGVSFVLEMTLALFQPGVWEGLPLPAASVINHRCFFGAYPLFQEPPSAEEASPSREQMASMAGAVSSCQRGGEGSSSCPGETFLSAAGPALLGSQGPWIPSACCPHAGQHPRAQEECVQDQGALLAWPGMQTASIFASRMQMYICPH